MACCGLSSCGFCFRHSKRSVLLLCFSVVAVYLVVHFVLKSPRFGQFRISKFQHPRFSRILNLEAWRNVTVHREGPGGRPPSGQRRHRLAVPRPRGDDSRLFQHGRKSQLSENHGVKSRGEDPRLFQHGRKSQLSENHDVKSPVFENERKAKILKNNKKYRHLQRDVNLRDFLHDRQFETFNRNVQPQPFQDDVKLKIPRDDGQIKHMQDGPDPKAMQHDSKLKHLPHDQKPKTLQDDVNLKVLHDNVNPKGFQHDVKPKPFHKGKPKSFQNDMKSKTLHDDVKPKALHSDRKLQEVQDDQRFQPLQRKVKSKALQGDRTFKTLHDDDVKLKALQSDARSPNLPPNVPSAALQTRGRDKALQTVLKYGAFPRGENPKTSQDKAKSRDSQTALKSKTLYPDDHSNALRHGWETIVEKLWARKAKNKLQQDDIHQKSMQSDLKFKHLQDGMNPKTAQNRSKPKRLSDTDEKEPGTLKFQHRVEEASRKGGYGRRGGKGDLVFPGKAEPTPSQFQQSAPQEPRIPQQKLDDHASKSGTHPKLKAGQKSRTADHSASSGGSPRNCGDYDFHTRDPHLQPFEPAVRGRDLCILLDTVTVLSETLMKAGITFFLTGKSLLGSWRHHGMVPWDDQVEIAVDYQLQKHLQNAVSSLRRGYQYDPHSGRFYSVSASPRPGDSWRWPFVTVRFFGQNSTHVFRQDADPGPKFLFPRDWVFPLVRRPFLRLSMPCPYQTRRVVDSMYSVDRCQVTRPAHRLQKGGSVPCSRLRAVYPFVQHVPLRDKSACLESVVKNGTVTSQMLFENVPC